MAWVTGGGKGLSGYGGMVGWAVGIPQWLDDPASEVNRYWRAIEEGATGWVGGGIAGLWGPNAEPRKHLWETSHTRFLGRKDQKFAPYFSKRGNDMLGPARAALWNFMEGGKGPNMDLLKVQYEVRWRKDKQGRKTREEVPISSGAAADRARKKLFFWFMTKSTDAEQIPFTYGVIRRPTPARHYYAKGWAAFEPTFKDRQLQAMREALHFALRGAKSETASQIYQAARAEFGAESPRGPSRISRPSGKTARVNANVGRYMPAGAKITAAADVHIQALVFDGGGRFVAGTFQGALQEANARLAQQLQQLIADQMTGTRPETLRLKKATLHEMNRYPRKIY